METFLRERGIDAGFERTGQLIVALRPEHLGALEQGREAAEKRGLAGLAHPLARRDAKSELASPLYEGALLAPRNGVVDPVRLTRGPARRGRPRGRPHSRADARHEDGVSRRPRRDRSLGRRDPPGARSSSSRRTRTRITCGRPSPARFLPLYDYVLVSDPLTPAQRKAIGWRSRRAVTDVRTFFNYYRLTDDGRILWGTSEAAYYSGQPRGSVAATTRRGTTRRSRRASGSTSRSSRAWRFRTAGAGRSPRPRG